MKKASLYILILIVSFLAYSQESNEHEDYNLIKTVLVDIASLKSNDTLRFHDEVLPFQNQDKIFTASFFEEYTYPAIGVNNEKIKFLLRTLDFEYLAKQYQKNERWNVSKINLKIIVYNEATKNYFKGRKQYSVSKPIYSKDKKFAFIYSHYSCGYMDCESKTLKIYKKKKGKWIAYTQIPITIS